MSELSGEGSTRRQERESPELETLMMKYQQADRTSAELFIQILIPMLTRFFLSTPDGRHGADDLVQETLLRLHRARHTYRPPDPVLPWVFAIARHVRVDQYRKRRRIAMREEAVEPEVLQARAAGTEPAPDELPDFNTLMSFLPDSQREVLTMLKVLGMSVDEVARATSTTAGSVKQKAHRAYERLRSVLNTFARTPTGAGGQ
jgi:RNA polymerase sigma-70 factor (ECF subfamily)